MAGRRSGVVFGLGVAAIAAFLAFRGGLFGGGTPTPVPEAEGPVAGPTTPAEPQRPQDSTPRPSPIPGPVPPPAETAPPAPPPGEPLPSVDVPTRITIRGLDAAALADARAYVVGTNREGRLQVVAAVPTPSSTVELVAPAAKVAGLSGLRAAVVAPGRPTGWSAPAEAGATGASLEVSMPEGVLLEGGVIDAQRAPIGGLSLVVTSAWGRTYAVFGEDLTFEGSVGRGTAAKPIFFTKTTTDGAGRFALRVPAGANLAILADHEAWKLEVPEGGHVVGPEGRNGLEVRAWPAFTVSAEIVSASGTAIASPLFGMDRGREELSFSEVFPTADVRVTSPRQGRVDRKVTGTLRASARGYDAKTEKFLVEPERTFYRVQMRLEPRRGEQEAAKIRIDVVDASGRPVVPEGGQKPFLRVRRAETGSSPVWVQDAGLRKLDDTTYEGEVPEGEWNVQLVFPQHFEGTYATDATLPFAAGRETPWRAVLPDGGPLTIRWAAKDAPAPPAAVSLGICPAAKVDDGAAWSWEVHPAGTFEARFARWPEGEWIVVVGDHGAKEPRRTVTVKHGAPAVADFTK